MSPVDGLELIAKVASGEFSDMPVILLTGFAESLGLTRGEHGRRRGHSKESRMRYRLLLRTAKKLLHPRRSRRVRIGAEASQARASVGS